MILGRRSLGQLVYTIIALGIISACTFIPVLPMSASSNTVVFHDSFSEPNSGWIPYKGDADSQISYTAGGLLFLVQQPYQDLWATHTPNLKDVSIEVDATKLGGPDDNHFGLICRYQDQKNFYAFLISSDGYYAVTHVQDGKMTIISGEEMSFSPSVQQGLSHNHLRADCISDLLTLYVHEQKLVEVKDDSLAAGEVGIIAGSYAIPEVSIYFDNFKVLKP